MKVFNLFLDKLKWVGQKKLQPRTYLVSLRFCENPRRTLNMKFVDLMKNRSEKWS